MKTKIILSCLLYLGCVSTGFTQSACTSGKLDSNAKKVLPFMPDLSLQQERDMPVAVRRNQSPPDLNPVPESKMQRIRITADSIPVIVFRPDHPVGKMPVIVDFHGGAFVYPLQPWMYHWSYELANTYGAIVFAVDYRVAPEHRFPVAVNDSYNAFKWVLENAGKMGGDTARIILSGASSGANLAAAVSLLAPKEALQKKIKMICLLCPAVANPVNSLYPSMTENATGYGLTKNAVLWATENYSSNFGVDSSDFRMFPILAKDFSGLPPAIIYTAEFDVLRDEGIAYAAKLKAAGVPVIARCFPGHLHTLMGIRNDAPEMKQIDKDMRQFIETYLPAH